jgi:hypothetical protein
MGDSTGSAIGRRCDYLIYGAAVESFRRKRSRAYFGGCGAWRRESNRSLLAGCFLKAHFS